MEKRKPSCPPTVVQTLATEGKIRATMSAIAGGCALGFDFDEVVNLVMSLTIKDFYKSMTTYSDHRVWQDVYRLNTKAGAIYLKLIVTDNVLIVSFKEL